MTGADWPGLEAFMHDVLVEGVQTGDYRRAPVDVETESGEVLSAEVYIAGEQFLIDKGRPSPWYLRMIVMGARQHGLPEFKLADVTQEMELLRVAKEDALGLLKELKNAD